jgi:hypothetical protein
MRERLVWLFDPTAPDGAALLAELGRGRAFLRGAEPPLAFAATSGRLECELVLEHPSGEQLSLAATVVYVQQEGPERGLGLELAGPELAERIAAFLAGLGDAEGPASGGERLDRVAQNVHERVRQLPVAQRERLARTGGLAERVALERAFGGSVWEALLQNPQLTGAEVARIARNGTAPAPLLVQIASSAVWLSRAEVRRALLQNTRLPESQLERVLRALPSAELRLVGQQSAYPSRVRVVAKRLVGR